MHISIKETYLCMRLAVLTVSPVFGTCLFISYLIRQCSTPSKNKIEKNVPNNWKRARSPLRIPAVTGPECKPKRISLSGFVGWC